MPAYMRESLVFRREGGGCARTVGEVAVEGLLAVGAAEGVLPWHYAQEVITVTVIIGTAAGRLSGEFGQCLVELCSLVVEAPVVHVRAIGFAPDGDARVSEETGTGVREGEDGCLEVGEFADVGLEEGDG